MRHSSGRAQRAAIDGYLERMVDTDLPELGVEVRNPATLQRWVRAYAAATSTTTSYNKIRDAATSGEDTKPAKSTTIPYRDARAGRPRGAPAVDLDRACGAVIGSAAWREKGC